ncbi:DUF3397 domain-containing protein [Lactobacillus hominis]|uniref:Uncharacterized protein n=1 Tax=Lactobacillus hominis DSM 23910 = CRBIP 24.179 TaxID=1423758 RepID=I7JU22_9LACO|nr:DUF3397 domain-containing protein [Lactobacillus hominis]KRM86146.1 hypothetical protein FC41_GL000339 [Lactobacillus hominis DSM 23910 = CRBIP 24.179]MCT3348632.1 DUF3397 domain-containing protein [Lactobacillus hominis]CCI80896.1 Putative uncharacterized protein [Lactobacillus hominis DSM 23910 = CRBIP 24.179]
MQLIWIFLLPIIGLAFAALVARVFPKAKFRGYDVLPFFFVAACQMITAQNHKPSFLPYGFLLYFVLVIIIAVRIAIENKNISLGKTIRVLWNYLTACSIFWYVGLLILVII